MRRSTGLDLGYIFKSLNPHGHSEEYHWSKMIRTLRARRRLIVVFPGTVIQRCIEVFLRAGQFELRSLLFRRAEGTTFMQPSSDMMEARPYTIVDYSSSALALSRCRARKSCGSGIGWCWRTSGSSQSPRAVAWFRCPFLSNVNIEIGQKISESGKWLHQRH